jgi:hypothetical protein
MFDNERSFFNRSSKCTGAETVAAAASDEPSTAATDGPLELPLEVLFGPASLLLFPKLEDGELRLAAFAKSSKSASFSDELNFFSARSRDSREAKSTGAAVMEVPFTGGD